MQLNNITTGQVIKLVKVSANGVAYDLFDNGLYKNSQRLTTQTSIDRTYEPEIPMSIEQLEDLLAYEILKSENVGFEISSDEKNWAIETGSTGLDTTVRILFPSDLISKHVFTNSPLWQLMTALQVLKPFSTESNGTIVQYLEEILDVPVIDGLKPIEILNMYPEIIIKYKDEQ